MEKPPRYTDVQFCNRAILGGWNEEKIEFTPGSQTRSHLRESRLPALGHNILIPVSLLAVVGFNWAALCAKQTQYLIHFVQTQCLLPLLQLTNKAQPHAGLETQILLCQTKLFPFGLYICR